MPQLHQILPMKKVIILLPLIFSTHFLIAQSLQDLPSRYLQVSLGYSYHGTDLNSGGAFSIGYGQFVRKRLSINSSLGVTMHSGFAKANFVGNNGQSIRTEVHYSTKAFQGNMALGFSFIRNQKHNLEGRVGTLVRYQTTTNPEVMNSSYGSGISSNIVNTYLDRYFTPKSLAFGGLASISYDYTFDGKIFMGVNGHLQYDFHKDALNIFSLVVGKRF